MNPIAGWIVAGGSAGAAAVLVVVLARTLAALALAAARGVHAQFHAEDEPEERPDPGVIGFAMESSEDPDAPEFPDELDRKRS